MKRSNLYVNPCFALWYLAKGDIYWGCSIINVGLRHWDYKKWPTNLSINRSVVLGGEQATLCFLHWAS